MSDRLPLALEILCRKNAYAYDPRFGYVASARAADRWVSTSGSSSLDAGTLAGFAPIALVPGWRGSFPYSCRSGHGRRRRRESPAMITIGGYCESWFPARRD